jgi:hypothetical protein
MCGVDEEARAVQGEYGKLCGVSQEARARQLFHAAGAVCALEGRRLVLHAHVTIQIFSRQGSPNCDRPKRNKKTPRLHSTHTALCRFYRPMLFSVRP